MNIYLYLLQEMSWNLRQGVVRLLMQNGIVREEMAELRAETRELRVENRALRDEMVRKRPLAPLALIPKYPVYAELNPPVHVPKGVVRQILDDEGVCVHDFVSYGLQNLKV